MSKHSFIYTVVEEFVEVDKKILKQIKDIKLTKDNNIPEMNYTSYYNESSSFNNFIKDKLSDVFKKYNLILQNSWVQKYSKNQIDTKINGKYEKLSKIDFSSNIDHKYCISSILIFNFSLNNV